MTKKKEIIAAKRLHHKAIAEVNDLKTFPMPNRSIPFPETRILFKELPGDRILITGFENFFTERQVKDQFGKDAYNAYRTSASSVFRRFNDSTDSLSVIGVPEGSCRELFVHPGDIVLKKEFNSIYSTIKKCGNTLHQIILAVNGPEKSIKI